MQYFKTLLQLLVFLITVGFAFPAMTSDKISFTEWLSNIKTEAIQQGISINTLNSALSEIQPIARVIELDRAQPESTITFEEYIDRVVTKSRIKEGRKKLSENRQMLDKVAIKYGVPPRFIVALWGIETNFGSYTGGFSVISALATLAYDGRRSAYFKKELLTALKILDEGHIGNDEMLGSWAGAMGQSQFMPSSFMNYAVDFDGDSRRDIWNTKADVFASAANYLKGSGWVRGQTWGRQVTLIGSIEPALFSLEIVKPLAEWHKLGVRRLNGTDLPIVDMSGSLIRPGNESESIFLVYENYRTILRWNRSHYFGGAVGKLADSIR